MTTFAALMEKQSLKIKATKVFGSQKAAEVWFESKVLGLSGARPVDLIRTRAGRKLVNDS